MLMRLRVIEQEHTHFDFPEQTIVVGSQTALQFDVIDDIDETMSHLLPIHRPPSREDCERGVRPCPYVSCRYNLYLDVRGDGVLRVNFPNLEPDEMLASCALDMSDDGPRTLDQVASLMGMSKERARQIEASALVKLREALGAHEIDELENS